MREILFRGKRADNGEWVYGFLWKKKYNTDKLFISCFPDEDDNEEVFVIYSETVGQYTGLTDKNGTKIFEGDILESPIGRKAVVSFGTYKPWSTKDSDDFECWKLTLIANNEYETKLECGLGKHCTEYMKVIGNIHDIPELLKEREGK